MANTIVIQPDADDGVDAFINDVFPNTNYGTDATEPIGVAIVSKTTQVYRMLLRLDLSGILPGSTITTATLTIFNTSSLGSVNNSVFYANRATVPGWTEFGATWIKYDGTNNWATAGGDFTTTDRATFTTSGTTNADLVFTGMAALVQDGVDVRGGLLHLLILGAVESGSNNWLQASSSDDIAIRRPKLSVTYDLPGVDDQFSWTAQDEPLDFTSSDEPLEFTSSDRPLDFTA